MYNILYMESFRKQSDVRRRRSLQRVKRTRAPPPPAGATPPAGPARGGASYAPATRTILKECGKSHTFLAGNLIRFWREISFVFGGKSHTCLAGKIWQGFLLAGNLTRLSFWREIWQGFLFGGKFDKFCGNFRKFCAKFGNVCWETWQDCDRVVDKILVRSWQAFNGKMV